MATQPLMAVARQHQAQADTGPSFTPKDPRQFTPPEQHDAVDRIVAAGVKIMFGPETAQERQQAVQSQEPVAKNIADNVTGLMLTLDQHAKPTGGLPIAALFPAAVMLANEAANMLVHAGIKVTQDDYNHALQIIYVQLGAKLHLNGDQLMKGAQNALAKNGGDTGAGDDSQGDVTDAGGAAPMAAPAGQTGMPPTGAVAPQQPDQAEQDEEEAGVSPQQPQGV